MDNQEHSPRVSRRTFLGTAAGAAAATAISAPAAFAAPGGSGRGGGQGGPQRDLALINGKIHTFDEHGTVVDKVLIRDNKISAVGDIGNGPAEVVNLGGRTVIPGLVDNHVHFLRVANRAGHDTRALETAFSAEAAQEVIAARASGVPEGEFITAVGGMHQRQFAEGRFPTLAELDEAAPHHGVYISQSASGPGQTNTLARDVLRSLGVTVSDDGVVASGGQTALASEVLTADLTDEDRKRQLSDLETYAVSIGLTATMDQSSTVPGPFFLDYDSGYDFFLDMVNDGAIKVRQRVYFPGTDNDIELTELRSILNRRWREFGPAMARLVGVGEWATGRQAFRDPLGDVNREATRLIAERGWVYHQHVISTSEIDGHLTLWEQLSDDYPIGDMHWSLGHLQGLTPSLIERANNLNVGLALHPYRYLSSTVTIPFRTTLDLATVPVGGGSDGCRISTLTPWNMIFAMVTGRNNAGQQSNEGEHITREEAIRLYAGPQQGWFSKEADRLGGIGVGRYADLAVLSADFFDRGAVPDEAIRHMTSVLTIVNGQVVHDAGEL